MKARFIGAVAFAVGLLLMSAASSAPVAAKNTPRNAAHRPASSSAILDGTSVLARYRDALSRYHTPSVMSYVYRVDQVGDHGLSQTHLLYRSGSMVRDETIALGGMNIKPRIHLFRNRAEHYAIEAVAPRESAYGLHYLGMHMEDGTAFYEFSTVPQGGDPAFHVTKIVLDGTHFLPVSIAFHAHAGMVQGDGILRYGSVEDQWVVTDAEAAGHGARHALREHLVFSEYHFPASLPAATFGMSAP